MNLDEIHDEPIDFAAEGRAVLPPQHAGYGRFARTKVRVVPDVQTSAPEAKRRRGFVVRFVAWAEGLHRAWYLESEAQQRHVVEEDARRLGGRVTWGNDSYG